MDAAGTDGAVLVAVEDGLDDEEEEEDTAVVVPLARIQVAVRTGA